MEVVQTKLQSTNHSRFGDAIWYDPEFTGKPITVGGAGGIGSWLCALLSRAGYRLAIYDDDNVDQTNFAGQLYTTEALGVNKATAVVSLCTNLGAEQKLVPFGRFTERSNVNPITFSAFDNMAARKLLFEKWRALPGKGIFVDGRMLAEAGQVYFVDSVEKEKLYEETLFDDKEVKEQPCSMKATSHCGAFIASTMMAGLTNWISNQKLNDDVRDVPFRIDFMMPLLTFTTKSTAECIKQSKPVPDTD